MSISMRTIDRVGAAIAGFTLVAAPVAVAAPALDDPAAPRAAATPKRGGAGLSDIRANDERRDAARRERRDGPFHPVVVDRFDYGEGGARFGASRGGRSHEGQDVFAPSGTPLVAVSDGVVLETGNDGGRGNYVSIFDPGEQRTYNYFHLVAPASVKPGERVSAGERIGAVGCTGSCWGEHLHFEVRKGRDPYGPALDPLPILETLSQTKR